MLNSLPSPKTNKGKVQVGRGSSSGHGGHVTGRGNKGQKSRSGYSRPRRGFEGGQMPLSRRLPKLKGFSRGFRLQNRKHFTLKLSEVAEAISTDNVTLESIVESGLVRNFSKKISLKIVFDKDITRPLNIEGIPVTAAVKTSVEKAGGKIV